MKKQLYIAVVAYMPHLDGKPDVAVSKALDGSGCYSSFIGYNKAAVTRKALRMTAQWEDASPNRKPGHYTVLVGKLENEATGSFTLKAIR